MHWTPEEQATLDDGLQKYASLSNTRRDAIIAQSLNDKTPLDVARRVRWINERVSARPKVPSYAPAPQLDNADDIPYAAIGGPTSELLMQNKQALRQISANFSSLKLQENINLLCQIRDNFIRVNFIRVKNEMDVSPVDEAMKKMGPFKLNINKELANSILPLPPQYQPQS